MSGCEHVNRCLLLLKIGACSRHVLRLSPLALPCPLVPLKSSVSLSDLLLSLLF